jgi:hypothetical protein
MKAKVADVNAGLDNELPVQASHDLKIEETAQGIRIHVHVYGNDRKAVIEEAFDFYEDSIAEAKTREILRAPMEIKKPKDEKQKGEFIPK